ncbi:PQQ-binding-like beta-propeller repeat protein, partial [Thermodesulfobacteriota bacterium]
MKHTLGLKAASYLLSLLLLGLCTLPAGCDLTGRVVWKYETSGIIPYVRSSPAYSGGYLYVGGSGFYCLNTMDGSLVWQYATSFAADSSPAVSGDFLYFCNDAAYCLNAASGALVWQTEKVSRMFLSPALYGEHVYAGSESGALYCLDGRTGTTLWSYDTGSAVTSAPAAAGGYVYAGCSNGTLYCLNAASGALAWQYATGSTISSCPAVTAGYVYVGSDNGRLYCLDAQTGAKVWQFSAGSAIASSPAVSGGYVYVGSDDGKLYCLSGIDGASVWQFAAGDKVRSSPAVTDAYVYFGCENNNIYCVDAQTGKQVWQFRSGGSAASSPAVSGGYVFAGSDDGSIYCLKGADGDSGYWPMFGANTQRTGSRASDIQELVFVEVTGQETPVAAVVTDKDSTEALAVLADKDKGGQVRAVTGGVYTSDEGRSLTMKLDPEGLPATLTDDTGYNYEFKNYSADTVDVRLFDGGGNLLQGPLTIALDPEALAEIKRLWDSLPRRTAGPGERGLTLAAASSTSDYMGAFLQGVSLGIGAVSCGVAASGAVASGGLAIPVAGVACGSFVANAASLVSDDEYVGAVSDAGTVVDGATCAATMLADVPSCVGFAADVGATLLLDEDNNGAGSTNYPKSPRYLNASAISWDQISLYWEAPASDNIIQYSIYRNGNLIDVVRPSAPGYPPADWYEDSFLLLSETEYCYTVVAKNAAGYSSEESEKTCAETWPMPTTSSSSSTTSTGPLGSSTTTVGGGYSSTTTAYPGSDDHGDSCLDATETYPGSLLSGTIDAGGDWDYFAFQLYQPGTLRIYTTGSIDSYGYLLDSGCLTLTFSDDANDANFEINHAVDAGTYYILVRGFSSATSGAYTLAVEFEGSTYTTSSSSTTSAAVLDDDHGSTCSEATSISYNSSLSGAINAGSDNDYFRVQLPESGTLRIYTAGATDTYGYLLDASCATITSNDDYTDANFEIEDYLSAGTYYIRVRGFGSSTTGTYTLYVDYESSAAASTTTTTISSSDDHGDSCTAATPVSSDGTAGGRIEAGGDNDYFRVQVPGSGNLRIYTTGSTDTYGYLLSSGCAVITSNDDATDTNFGISTYVSAGTYYIRVRGFSSSTTGTYSLSVSFQGSTQTSSTTTTAVAGDDHGDSCSAATSISYNSPVSGFIEMSGDNDYFRVQLSQPGALRIYTTGSTDTYGYLLDASCATITSNDDSSSSNFEIEDYLSPGTYYIRVRGFGSATGAYTLFVDFSGITTTTAAAATTSVSSSDDHGDSCSGATATVYNSNISGSIEESGDNDYFRVQVYSSGTLRIYTTG